MTLTPDDLHTLTSHLEVVVRKTVNGKIDNLTDLVQDHNEKHERDMLEVREHMTDVKPILEAYNGTKALGNLVKWVGGIVLTVGAVWAIFSK